MGSAREIVLWSLVGVALGSCILVVAELFGGGCRAIAQITGIHCRDNGDTQGEFDTQPRLEK